MGCYVNPQNMTKEEWLIIHGTPSTTSLKWAQVPAGMLPVILVNNGLFTAAAVAYKPSELTVFLEPDDPRPKKVYLCQIDELLKASDLDRYQ